MTPLLSCQVGTVSPTSLYPDATWLIGNHSDELTPWIPVIASKSSPLTNVFIIPCCPYDLDGQKFVRKNTFVSQYSDYLTYVERIFAVCGFETRTDKLRIPSTKRRCLVGTRSNFNGWGEVRENVEEFLASRGCSDFKPRSSVELVRNCTQLNRDVIGKLVMACVVSLLTEKNYVTKANGDCWNCGGGLTISQLSKVIPKEDLKQLKEQCGGLQTLLRNHRYLFEIGDGKVFLRKPPLLDENTKKYKGKPCWFVKNHPDGCLHSSEVCSYYHDC